MGNLPVLLAASTAAILFQACRPSDPPKVATIPADVSAVDAGPPLAIAATPPEERDDPIEEANELPGGKEAIGKHAPGFNLEAVSRGKVRLLRNKITVVHFWATWCAPCKKSFGTLQKLHEQYAERGVMVVGISVDDEPEGVPQFAKQHGASFHVAWDPDHKIANLYKPQTMPSTFVIDRTGIVRSVIDGYHEGDNGTLEDAITSLL